MKNNKGQALIEFVLVLPLFLLLLFAVIDFGIILNAKNVLENKIPDVRLMLKANENINEIKSFINQDEKYKIDLTLDFHEGKTTINLSTKINLITPGLNRVLTNPYVVKVDRVIRSES